MKRQKRKTGTTEEEIDSRKQEDREDKQEHKEKELKGKVKLAHTIVREKSEWSDLSKKMAEEDVNYTQARAKRYQS